MYRPLYDDTIQSLVFIADERTTEDVLSGSVNVFVCGGLQNPEKMANILGRNAPFAPAAANGYARTVAEVGGEQIPFMVPADDPGSVLTGVVWLDLGEQDVKNIETLELKGNVRKRVEIRVQVGEKALEALTYVRR